MEEERRLEVGGGPASSKEGKFHRPRQARQGQGLGTCTLMAGSERGEGGGRSATAQRGLGARSRLQVTGPVSGTAVSMELTSACGSIH